MPASRLKDVIAHARELWSQFYGSVRASGSGNRKRRCDHGCPRMDDDSKDSGKPSLAKWVRSRRQAVACATASSSGATLPPDDALWTEKQQKELDFQKAGATQIPVVS